VVMLILLAILDVMMEPVPMMFLVVPITSKAIFTSGIHWITFNFLLLQYSAVMFCTPPLAMALFALAQFFKVRIEDVTKGVIPFLIVLYLHMILFLFFPGWLLWLPRLVFGNRVDLPVQY
jgi:C4-dicarboxylate transporter DctM subunit